jgi:hypothetical protein
MQEIQSIFEKIRDKPFSSLLVGGALLVLGILFSDIPRGIASQGWPTIEGNIILSKVEDKMFKEYEGDYYMDTVAYIRYQYSVNGIPYSSSAVDSTNTPFYSVPTGRRYPVGKDVVVHYNPTNPSEAVLEPGLVLNTRAFEGISFCITGPGIFIVALSLLGLSGLLEDVKGNESTA